MEQGPYSSPRTGENQIKVIGLAVNQLGLVPAGRFDSCLAHESKQAHV